jgi:hypothetical protein
MRDRDSFWRKEKDPPDACAFRNEVATDCVAAGGGLHQSFSISIA